MYLKCLYTILRFSSLHTFISNEDSINQAEESTTELQKKCCVLSEKIAEILTKILENEKSAERIFICMEVAEALAQIADIGEEGGVWIGKIVKSLARDAYKQCKKYAGFKKRVNLLKS